METRERRKYVRLPWSFPVSLRKEGLEDVLEGASANISQMGAFIRIESWSLFQVQDQAAVIWTLPREFTGQSMTIRLQGEAVIRRVDREHGGIAVEFLKTLRAFQRVNGES